ncbi:MAG: c-type heme family protein [Acetobacteraceae bacterium]
MGLRTKFNLMLLAAFVVGLGLAAAVSWRIVQRDARREVLQQAGIMMAEADAVIDYTGQEVGPLLVDQQKLRFLPQSVPFFAAEANLRALSKKFPDYTFKEAALDPTNPADRATDWEAAIIAEFRHSPTLTSFVSTRQTPVGPILSLSHPVRIDDKACLTCHSTPAAAPPAMVDLYGRSDGFGWTLGSVQGAQIVSVPMRVALGRADRLFLIYLGCLAAVFAVTLLLLNLLLQYVIIRPVRRMAAIASEVSLGNADAPEFEARGGDEISSLAQSFNRMRRSLVNAMKLLEG